jgi:hypothetical protein
VTGSTNISARARRCYGSPRGSALTTRARASPVVPASGDYGAIDLSKGGGAIPYHLADAYVHQEYEQALNREGTTSRMNPDFYLRPPAEGEEIRRSYELAIRGRTRNFSVAFAMQ